MKNSKKSQVRKRKTFDVSLLSIIPLLLLFLSIFFSCTAVEGSVLKRKEDEAEKRFYLIPEGDEIVYARRIASEIEKEIVILKDKFLSNFLDRIKNRIINRTRFGELVGNWEWSFKIIDSPDINAFTTLGGQVYIYRGLIEATESESELAGILAFETGHVMAHHVHQQINKKLMNQPDFKPGEIIAGDKGWERLDRIFLAEGGAFAFFSNLEYDSSKIEKADEFALINSYDAEFDPQGFVTLVNRLGISEEPSFSWMRKNPWNPRRQKKLLAYLKLLPSFPFYEDPSGFNELRSLLKSLPSTFLREGMDEYSETELETDIQLAVLGDLDWTDSGLDVREGQEIYFDASGQIILQEGNPIAHCGPEGYPLQDLHQPFTDRNKGALIGRVVWLISVEINEEKEQDIRHEVVEKFFIGPKNTIMMPLNGRLYLGINENVVGDNSGEFEVKIRIRKKVRDVPQSTTL
ncbi:MAG: M48 family metalloprotease [Candidatus Aminicenantes bacterium]|nr:M48 family metalloprotease [Candidatus Aminicenantes bacterium]